MQVNDAPNIFRRDHLDSTPGIDFCLQLFSGDTINIHRPGCEAVAELAVMCWKGPLFLEHFATCCSPFIPSSLEVTVVRTEAP